MEQRQLQTFNDGICFIYSTNDDRQPSDVLYKLRFNEKVVGFNRYFTAMAQQKVVNRVIRVPQRRTITEDQVVMIDNEIYEIIQVQHINDTLPAVTDLTLKRLGMKV